MLLRRARRTETPTSCACRPISSGELISPNCSRRTTITRMSSASFSPGTPNRRRYLPGVMAETTAHSRATVCSGVRLRSVRRGGKYRDVGPGGDSDHAPQLGFVRLIHVAAQTAFFAGSPEFFFQHPRRHRAGSAPGGGGRAGMLRHPPGRAWLIRCR